MSELFGSGNLDECLPMKNSPRGSELSMQQTDETSNQRVAALALTWRPHLVSATEIRVQDETAVETGLEAEAAELYSARTIFERSPVTVTTPTGVAAVPKRLLDVIGAVILGLVFSPLMLMIVLLMRKGDSSAIYRHRRVGRGGQMFSCLKFRTMVPNADQVLHDLIARDPELKAEWIRDHKLRHDPRVTRLGRFLRRTSLDELPQLMNVLRGEMSLVGPRPVIREELIRYGRSVGTYLAAKPGITGLWQVTGRNDTDYRRRVVLDAYYVRNQNLLLDLYVLMKTIGVVLSGNGAY
jgi:exopolysaccharide production protein ExoY